MEVVYQYSRLRRNFGRQPNVIDESAELLTDIRPNDDMLQDYTAMPVVSTATQVVPSVSGHEANTAAVSFSNSAMNHIEGGWPKEVDHTDADQVIRYRKKVEKDEEYIKAVVKLGATVEDIVKVNNAIDIYEEYFTAKVSDNSRDAPTARTLTVLNDPSGAKRSVQYLSWHPDGCNLAVVHAVMEFQQQPPNMPLSSYVWDVEVPNRPKLALTPQSQLTCINFNLKDANLLGGGLYNGQLAVVDTRSGGTPVQVSPLEHSHRDPVYDLAWLQSKSGTEAMSVSTDGCVLWWDIRKLGEPLESLILKEKGGDSTFGAMVLDYAPSAGPTKFMVGTEQGAIVACNRKAKTPPERVIATFPGHHGPVYGLQHSPFYPKMFLSIGDWTARVWNEDFKTPIMTSKYQPAYLTGGAWSPTRPGVFFTIKIDGCLDVWDYYQRQSEPALTLQAADGPLTSFCIQASGAVAAIGAAMGTTAILRFSSGITEMQPNEKQAITSILERETNREKNLEKSVKEAKIRARKAAEAKMKSEVGPLAPRQSVIQEIDEELRKLEEQFYALTREQAATSSTAAAVTHK